MDLFQIAFAFSLGFASAVTPCVLPIVPSYLAFVFGSERFDLLKGSMLVYFGVIVGGIATAAAIGLVGGVIGGRWFLGASAAIISLIIIDKLFTHRLRGIPTGFMKGKRGSIAGFLFGMLIMLIAAPCILPLLAALSIYALTVGELAARFAIMMAYSAGLGLPFFLIGAFAGFGKKLVGFSKWSERLQVAVLLVTLGWILWSLAIA